MVNGPRLEELGTPIPTLSPQTVLPAIVIATMTPTSIPRPEALVFDREPVAVHLSLADGPGTYTVDLFWENGAFLRRIFEQKIQGDLETWVEWDARLSDGRQAPSGAYQFVCSKEDRELKRIWIVLKTQP